jgi:hypothetical protein
VGDDVSDDGGEYDDGGDDENWEKQGGGDSGDVTRDQNQVLRATDACTAGLGYIHGDNQNSEGIRPCGTRTCGGWMVASERHRSQTSNLDWYLQDESDASC